MIRSASGGQAATRRNYHIFYTICLPPFQGHKGVLVAEWLSRSAVVQEVPGSNPGGA